jgi:hypothetical protein
VPLLHGGSGMTTEIAVINRLGLALATDSAVTISGGGNDAKVFDTGDKLFELVEQHPIGIMINGNMDFLGVPWELLIKDFRVHAKACPHGSMRAWVEHLLDFTAKHAALTVPAQNRYVRDAIIDSFETVKRLVSASLFAAAVSNDRQLYRTIYGVIDGQIALHTAAGIPDSLKGVSEEALLKRYGLVINRQISQRFQPVEVKATMRRKLRQLALCMLRSKSPTDHNTGLIIGGFAHNDMFPSLCVVEIDGAVLGTIRSSIGEERTVHRTAYPGGVISFAQTDVIDRILGGADNRFIEQTDEWIKSALGGTKDALVDLFSKANMTPSLASGVLDDIIGVVSSEYREQFAKTAKTNFQKAFNDMVAMMPKRELIELAEALVSITTIERKATSGQATVGGPVDVAFITKHDGFVWIKRKHYFESRLNPRYFWRKYGISNQAGGIDGTEGVEAKAAG